MRSNMAVNFTHVCRFLGRESRNMTRSKMRTATLEKSKGEAFALSAHNSSAAAAAQITALPAADSGVAVVWVSEPPGAFASTQMREFGVKNSNRRNAA